MAIQSGELGMERHKRMRNNGYVIVHMFLLVFYYVCISRDRLVKATHRKLGGGMEWDAWRVCSLRNHHP